MGLTLNGKKVLDRTLLHAQEFILDADQDSSLTADTDDQLDLRLGGNDVFVFKTSELDITGVNIVNCGDIALDSISDDDSTGINIAMMDASAIALTIKEAANAYLTFDTSNGTENIILGKKLTGGAVEIEGSAFDINGGTVDGITSLTVGTDGSGADVYFYSATGGDHLFWDSSEELLTVTGTNGQTALNVADGNMIVADTFYLFDAGGESLASDGTDLTIASGALINLTATSDVIIPVNIGLVFGDGAEKIESNNADLTINSGVDINLTAVADINVPANVGMTFGNDGEKIEGDATDLTIASSNLLNLAATTDVVIPVNVGLHLGDGAEKIESNNTDLTINSGVDINLTATTDINVPANVGMTFGDDGEKIEGDGTDLTIASSGVLNLNATSGIAINGQDITNGGVIFLTEQAAAEGDVEAKGQIWVKTATPNELWFTDDAGTDVEIGAAGPAPAGQIFLTSAGGWPSTTNGCAAPVKTEHGTNDVDVYTMDFDKDSDEFAQWTVAMPSDYGGGTITAVFYWTYTTGSGAETVEWNIMGRSYANDEAIDQAWGTEQAVSDAAIAAGDAHISAATSACTLGGTPAASELVQFRAYRDVSGDNLAGDARLIGVMVAFTRS